MGPLSPRAALKVLKLFTCCYYCRQGPPYRGPPYRGAPCTQQVGAPPGFPYGGSVGGPLGPLGGPFGEPHRRLGAPLVALLGGPLGGPFLCIQRVGGGRKGAYRKGKGEQQGPP